MESDSAPADIYLDDLTTKIRGELEAELEEKVSKKVQDNCLLYTSPSPRDRG